MPRLAYRTGVDHQCPLQRMNHRIMRLAQENEIRSNTIEALPLVKVGIHAPLDGIPRRAVAQQRGLAAVVDMPLRRPCTHQILRFFRKRFDGPRKGRAIFGSVMRGRQSAMRQTIQQHLVVIAKHANDVNRTEHFSALVHKWVVATKIAQKQHLFDGSRKLAQDRLQSVTVSVHVRNHANFHRVTTWPGRGRCDHKRASSSRKRPNAGNNSLLG